jgi:hypothetical protein
LEQRAAGDARPSDNRLVTVYTIGHSTRSEEEVLALLRDPDVKLVADVRAYPSSRRYPQFNRSALTEWLGAAGIRYVHMPGLGGRRVPVPGSPNGGWREAAFQGYADYMQSAEFQRALADLEATARELATAVMCAEAVWWRCHRRIVTDHVLAHGVPVVHLFSQTKCEPASPTPFAVIGARARVSYPATHAVCAHGARIARGASMVHSSFHVGDRVSWNSEAGRVRGVITKRLTAPTKLKGYTVRASKEEPQYLIVGDKTGHLAVHKGSALRRLRIAGSARATRGPS